MTLPRRRRPIGPERQATVNDAMVPGSFRGGVPSLAPVLGRKRLDARSRGITSTVNVTSRSSQIDQFTLSSGGAQTKTLTYLPIVDSWNVTLNGITALETTDYTISGTTLSLLTALDARTADVVQVQYDYLTGVPLAPSDPPPDAALFLPLSEASGLTAYDFSGNGRDGYYNGVGSPGFHTTSLRADGGNYAVTFSGDDFVDVPQASWMEATTMSVDAFIKTSTSGSKTEIASRDQIGAGWRIWQFAVDATGKLQLALINPSFLIVTSSVTVNDGAKHHVGAVVDGTNAILYVDGVADTTSAWAHSLPTTLPARFSVGTARSTSGDTPSELFVGVIDEVGYYTRALSASDMALLAAR